MACARVNSEDLRVNSEDLPGARRCWLSTRAGAPVLLLLYLSDYTMRSLWVVHAPVPEHCGRGTVLIIFPTSCSHCSTSWTLSLEVT